MPTLIVYWSPGRTAEQKAIVVHEITETLVRHGGARREDVLIIFQDIEPGNAGRAGVILQPPVLNSKQDTKKLVPPPTEDS
ncbi:MAG: 4-oxalocrotonate tautomerase family protein [Chloroflexota bacterium]